MLLFMTIALIHNANVLLTLCRGTQNSSRHKLIIHEPQACDRQSGSEKRMVHDPKRGYNRPAYTPKQEHMELHLHQHFDTHDGPSCSLHKATNHILYWTGTPTMMVPKQAKRCGNTGSPCLYKPMLGHMVTMVEWSAPSGVPLGTLSVHCHRYSAGGYLWASPC